MIKANELRIGNLVKGAADKIYAVDANIIGICTGSPDWVDPIPLTPEILEKCVYDENFFDVIKFRDGYSVSDNEGGSLLCEPIYHLHQLQNLYHALTGEELMIEDLNVEATEVK